MMIIADEPEFLDFSPQEAATMEVFEVNAESVPTGVLDAGGNMIYRQPRKQRMGYDLGW